MSNTEPLTPSVTPLKGRLSEPLRTNYRIDEIEKKKGNYILTYGRAGAGKTVFHWHLFRYLLKSGEFITNFTSVGDEDISTGLINGTWEKYWRYSVLPPSTHTETLLEFNIKITPARGKRIPLQLSFFEISGESLSRISATYNEFYDHKQHQEINDTLSKILSNTSIGLSLVFIVNGRDPHQSDAVFRDLITYLNSYHSGHLHRMPCLLIVSDKASALHSLIKDKHIAPENRNQIDVAEKFLSAYMPNAYAYVKSNRKNNSSTFDIGKVKEIDVKKKEILTSTRDHEEAFSNEELASGYWVDEIQFKDTDKIFRWIYYKYTNTLPNSPTFIQRLFIFIKELFS